MHVRFSIVALLTLCDLMTRFPSVTLAEQPVPLAARPSAQEGRDQSIYLHKTVAVPITPQDAFFLIEYSPNGFTTRQRGQLVPVNDRDVDNARWLVGTKVILPPDVQNLNFSLVLVSKDSHYFFFPPETIGNLSSEDLGVDPYRLKEQLKDKLAELRNLELTGKKQEASLNRLRADAEIIGNFNQIFSAHDEKERLLAEIRGLSNDIETMKNFSKVRPEPANFSRREGELTRQLAELAAAARNVESGESDRRMAGDENDMLGSPEEVRQLQELRQHRIELERRAEDLQNY